MDPNSQPGMQPPVQPTPNYQAPAAPGTPPTNPAGEDPGKTLAIVGIVLAFFFSIAGLVVSIIAKSKSKAAGFNNTLATVGIILNAAFMVLGILFAIFWFVVILSAAGEVSKTVSDQVAKDKQVVDAKKDFSKGEVGKFDDIEVTVNSVKRGFKSDNRYLVPAEGKEYVVVNVTIKNVSDESKYVGSATLQLNDNGVAGYATFVSGVDDIESGNLSPGASTTGDIAFEVKKGATGLKLQYEKLALITTSDGVSSKQLSYTLAI